MIDFGDNNLMNLVWSCENFILLGDHVCSEKVAECSTLKCLRRQLPSIPVVCLRAVNIMTILHFIKELYFIL